MNPRLNIAVLPPTLAICRLPVGAGLPDWCRTSDFLCYVRSFESTSIVCDQDSIPAGLEVEGDWRLLRLEGEWDFDQFGILAALIGPLGAARIPSLVVSTFETDYLLVRAPKLDRAIEVLRAHSHCVSQAPR